MNYYAILNVSRDATDNEIKKAYRTLAKQHHPDAGGDEAKFKEITEAYNILSDPDKRKIVDLGGDPNTSHTNDYGFRSGGFGFGDLRDIFSQFHQYANGENYRKNKSVITRISITLEEVLTGKEIDAEIALPGNNAKTVSINIPPGVETGQQVKFKGMGDASIVGIPAGDLIVHIHVLPHSQFERVDNNLISEYTIPVWDAILGTSLHVNTLDNTTLNLKIRPGTQPGTIYRCTDEGLPTLHSPKRGSLLVKINVNVPKDLTKEQKQIVEQLKDSFLTTNNEDLK